MKGSDLLVDCLAVEGVDHVFGIPGEELTDVMFSLRDSDVRFVPVRHEQGAAFMADVYGRLTGDAGVCLSTLGPGATNLLTGVADATLDKAPVVAITGQAGQDQMDRESHQTLDVVDMFAPVTKWNAGITAPGSVPEMVRKAFKVAQFEKPGATHLEFPEDVAPADVDADPLPTRDRVRRPDPDAESVRQAVDLLAAADHPIVLAGNGAVRTPASDALRAFVEATDLPVVATYMGKGAISDADDHSLLTLDSGPEREGRRAIERADCVLAVGYDVAEHDPADWNPALDTTVIHVDVDPAEVYRHYNPAVEILSDPAAALRELTDAAAEADVDGGTAWCADYRERILETVSGRPDAGDPFSVRRTLPLLRDAMADDDVLVSDVGSHKMAIAQDFPTYEPNTCVISNGLASMGIGVPGGLAADLAVDSNVVVATGDGGFLMNAAEIETATRIGCGFTILLFVDDDYGLISENQEVETGDSFGTRIGNPDFVAFAESFGIDAYRPDSWDELESVLAETVDSDAMSLVEVAIE